MYDTNRHGFTMIELVFVIVVIGILSAIAIPKFAATRDDAVISKARDTVASVRNALSTERQKNILRGQFTDMNKTAIGDTSTQVFTNMLEYPVKKCQNSSERDCWTVGGTPTVPIYTYRGPGGVDTAFTLQNNRLNCTSNCDNFNF